MILFLSFLFYVDATCLTTGIYNLAGLSPSVSVISSSINSSTQPILKFPSSLVPPVASRDPTRANAGLLFTNQKYVEISSKWTQSTDYSTDLSFWVFYISGELGPFIQVGLENYYYHPRLITIKGEYSSGIQYFNGYLGTFVVQIKEVKHGWNLISFNLWEEYFERNICQLSNCSGYNYNSKPGIGLLSSSDTFYLGCKYCTDTSVSYIIYSIKSMKNSDSSSCSSNPLSNALSNTFGSCGNLIKESGETCDDGNLDDGDGCTSHCAVESGFACGDPTAQQPEICDSCGNGFRPQTTGCDDGNIIDGDGCSSTCTIESGWSCSGGSSTSSDSCSICGNGLINNSIIEECDDNNIINGDGCSKFCKIEFGWNCIRSTPSTPDDCTEICGDGFRFNSISSYCDDGNIINGDGCNSVCSVEAGWTCSGGSNTKKDTCKEICGDGIKFNSQATYCDDGNLVNGDGCDNNCTIEVCYGCTGGSPTSVDVCSNVCGSSSDACGNGFTQTSLNEKCDDGNKVSGDGCSNICTIENGYSCTINIEQHYLSYCSLSCGNGKIDAGEECDDGNSVQGDGCNIKCKVEFAYTCKNYIDKPSFCSPNCGNGQRDKIPIYEQCDDGNNMDLDGCSINCTVETNYICNQNAIGTDICTSIFANPKVSNTSFDNTNLEIIIEFDQIMQNQTITLFDIALDISGLNSPYTTTLTANFDKKKLKISFSSSPSLLGGMNEIVKLQFTNVLAFKSEHGLSIEAPAFYQFVVSNIGSSEGAKSASSGASYTFIFVLILSLLVSIVIGGSIEEMWSLANTMQIMFFYLQLSLFYPSELKTIFAIMKFSNFDNPLFEYMRSKSLKVFDIAKLPIPQSYDMFGLSFSSVLINSCDKLFLISLMILFVMLLAFLSFCLRKKSGKFSNFIKKKDSDIRYEGLTRFFMEIMLNLSFLCFINLIFGNLIGIFNIISYIVAILLLIANFYVMIYCFVYPSIYYSYICVYPDKNEKHCLLFLNFNREKVKNLLFYGYFALHRIAFSFVVVCMKNLPTTQLVCILVVHIWMLINTFCPFKKALQNFLHTFNLIILCILSLLLFLFIDSQNINKLKISGYTFIGILAIFFLVNLFIVIPNITLQIYRKIREKCHKKTKEEIEQENKIKTIIHIPSLRQDTATHAMREIKVPEISEDQWRNIVIEKINPRSPRHPNNFRMIVEENKHIKPDFYQACVANSRTPVEF